VEESALLLQSELDAGGEVPFELASQASRGRGTPLYCYRPLTEAFVRERWNALRSAKSYAPAAELLGGFEGLDRYLLAREARFGQSEQPLGWRASGPDRRPASRERRPPTRARADAALRALLGDVFAEQSDFSLREERLRGALERLDCTAHAGATEVTLLATLHGLTIASPELALAPGLTLARPDELLDLPEGALAPEHMDGAEGTGHLVVAFTTEDTDAFAAIARGREVLRELLRALRLFGDGRIALGRLAWARAGGGAWGVHALGWGGRPHGMLLVSSEQEDELRAFCNLVSRRAPGENELAWALARFEMGCERGTELEALSDYLLALRVLLEPEGPTSGLLAGRLAALCATPAERPDLTGGVVRALALERAAIEGRVSEHGGSTALVRELANHLRALLRDVVCGHLKLDLVALADELLAARGGSGEEHPGDAIEAEEILNVPV
jgi:hypothetical protein